MHTFNLAIRNLLRRPRRSLTLLFIMSAAVFLLFMGNAAFDGTSAGLAQSFLRSFTGDLVVRAKDIESFSLFGNETPVIGEFSTLPEIAPWKWQVVFPTIRQIKIPTLRRFIPPSLT